MKKMNNRTFLMIHSVVYALFAVGLFVIPGLLWPNYGLELNDKYAVFLSQHTSIFLGGIAIIGFLLKEVEQHSFVAKRLMLGLLLTNVLGVIITLYAAFTGIFTGFGWSDPIFFAFLSLLSFVQWNNNEPAKSVK